MDLEINDVASLLNVDKQTIFNWVEEGKIPAYRIQEDLRFSKLEIEEWVVNQNQSTLSESKIDQTGQLQFLLYRSIFKGGVFSDIEGSTKEELIKNTMEKLATSHGLDQEVLTDLLLDREKLMPTAIGNGIAIPHARDYLNKDSHDIVITVFPKNPIEYGALDKKKVHALFFLFASDDKRHLNLLSKIAHLAADNEAQSFLQTKPNSQELLEYIKTWEQKF